MIYSSQASPEMVKSHQASTAEFLTLDSWKLRAMAGGQLK